MDMLTGCQRKNNDKGDIKENLICHDRKYFLKKLMSWAKVSYTERYIVMLSIARNLKR